MTRAGVDPGDVWADAMLAAALIAVDPRLGGAVVRCGPGPVREAWLSGLKALMPPGAPWKRLPPGVGDDRLLGGLDLAAMLAAQAPSNPAFEGSGARARAGRSLQRGLLAEADGGVVIVPMAERMTPGTAARLATALDDGAVGIEREGLAERLPTRFAVVALDEGLADERPPEVMVERLAFRLDLDIVGWRDAQPISATPADIAEAQATLATLVPPDEAAIQAICAAADALGVWSLRASWFALRVAAALAALAGRETIEGDDLGTAARLVLSPRATRLPPSPVEPQTQDPQPADGEDASFPDPAADHAEGEAIDDGQGGLDDRVLAAARAALPEGLEAMWLQTGSPVRTASPRSGPTGARIKAAKRGRRLGSRPGRPDGAGALDLVETLKAAAPWQRLRGAALGRGRGPLKVRRDDFRIRRFEQRSETTVIFVVDASGSAALQRLAETKGAVELLLAEAYVRRTQVALIAFRGEAAALLLPPTRSLARARRELAGLAGGGATPLASAIEAGGALAVSERAKGRTPLLILMTDGRGNIALDGGAFRTRAEQDALNAARRVRAAGVSAAVIDISPRPRGDAARVAEALGARFAALPHVEAERVRDLVSTLDRS